MRNQIKAKFIPSSFAFIFPSIFASIIIAMIALAPEAQADNIRKVDIYAPGKPVPIAISPLAGLPGQEISSIVTKDLNATGLFTFLDPAGFSESPTEPFNQANWLPTQVVAVLKGAATISPEGDISATATLYDVQSGAVLFSKNYGAPIGMLRPLAHDISSDIFKALTGLPGAFKCKLSYLSETRGGKKNIVIADWDAQRPHTLKFNERLLMPPRWSRDGNSLFYSAERGGAWGIYRLNLAALKEGLVFYRPGTSLIGDIGPSGQILFSSSYQSSPNIYIIEPDGDGRYGPPKRLTHTNGINVSPALSPDGKQIAYASDRDGTPQIYVMNVDGSNIRRVTFQGSYNTSPVWSPDGKRIAFAGRVGGINQIFTVRPDGSDLAQLTAYGNNEDPCFSPDGSMIAFSSDRGGVKSIYTMSSKGMGQRRVKTIGGASAYGPRWSYN